MPAAYIEKLKRTPILIGHERCASSNFSETGTLIVCANHHYGIARSILVAGKYYFGCRECIEENCKSTSARTEPRPRGVFEDLSE